MASAFWTLTLVAVTALAGLASFLRGLRQSQPEAVFATYLVGLATGLTVLSVVSVLFFDLPVAGRRLLWESVAATFFAPIAGAWLAEAVRARQPPPS
jgi:hypothetical protein